MKINQETLEVLNNSRIEGNALFLPPGQLERALYVKVNKVLENLGGKWNRKTKSHVFTEDIEEKLLEIINTGEYTDKKKELQFFQTPAEIVKQMVELAEIKNGDKVIEPSCGLGNIACEVYKITPAITCVEINKEFIDKIKKDFEFSDGFINGDFLESNPTGDFDKVVMNPPFSKQQDIDHIIHAFSFLKFGGILVSVVSESPFFRENSKSQQFRNWLLENNGTSIKLPEGAFSKSGTNVRTRIIKVKKT